MYLNGNYYDFLDREAYRILYDYGMFSFPLNVYELARKLNAEICFISKKQIVELESAGVAEKLNDGCVVKQGYRYTLFLNEGNSEARTRFTIAHEIAHIVLGDEENDLITESAADHFARILLVPPILLVEQGRISYNEIERQFAVSSSVAQRVWKIARNREESYGDKVFDYERDFYNEYKKRR